MSRPTRRIAVLGGTGFVGTALVSRLAAAGHELRVLTRDPRNGRSFAVLPTVRVLQAVMPVIGVTDAAAQARADALDARAADGDRVRGLRLVGTPARIADELERWFRGGAADGFHLLPAELPADVDACAGLLVPELQRRGVFRTEYAGRTLREHLQLPRPVSQFAGAPTEAHTAYHG